jgi:hypothetical protein
MGDTLQGRLPDRLMNAAGAYLFQGARLSGWTSSLMSIATKIAQMTAATY